GPADGCPEPSHDAPELAVQVLRPEVFSRHNRLLRKPAHINSELFLVRQLSVICARSHDVRSWLGELCCRDGFAVFHLNGSGIKRDRRRPAPEKPIDTESQLRLISTNSITSFLRRSKWVTIAGREIRESLFGKKHPANTSRGGKVGGSGSGAV